MYLSKGKAQKQEYQENNKYYLDCQRGGRVRRQVWYGGRRISTCWAKWTIEKGFFCDNYIPIKWRVMEPIVTKWSSELDGRVVE